MEHQQQQPISPHDESTVSANPSPDAAFTPHPHRKSLDSTSGFAILPLPNASSSSSSHEQAMPYAAYANTNAAWDAYSPYLNTADALHIPPVIYNDNSSLMYHSAYGFNPDMAYGQYSPVATHLPSIMLDGQLYSPQHFPFSPSFYPPNAPSSAPLTPTELMTSDSNADNLSFGAGAGSGYLLPFGSFGGGNMSGTPGSSTLPSSAHYPQPMGILGPYDHHTGQVSQQTPMHGYGLTSSSSIGHYQHGVSYHNSNFGSGSASYAGANNQVQLTFDKGRRKERNQEPFYASNDSLGFDHNRGPRASRVKAKSSSEHSSSSGNLRDDSSGSKVNRALYNKPDFVTDYNIAKFFIIKSFSEDNVHKSIKYSVWASTPHGNKKMDAAYHEAKEKDGNCPVFLLFSVNASGQFCGVAEMVGAVDFEKDVDYWQQDRWSGQFPVKWHIIKDVPNSRFRHILLENNDNKPVTHSRDSQELKLEQGIEMLKIFKDHVAHSSILDDFDFYNERERALKERKAKQQINSTMDAPGLIGDETINQVSDSFRQTLHFGVGNNEATRAMSTTVSVTTPATNSHAAVQPGNDSSLLVSQTEDTIGHQLSRPLNFEGGESQIRAAELGGDNQD